MWLIFQIIFLIGAASGYLFLWKAIQHGQMFGKWQMLLDWLYGKGYKHLSMFLGDCVVCFAHFISWLMFILNVVIMNIEGDWVIDSIIGNIIYALVWVAISWRLCIYSYYEQDKKEKEAQLRDKELEDKQKEN